MKSPELIEILDGLVDEAHAVDLENPYFSQTYDDPPAKKKPPKSLSIGSNPVAWARASKVRLFADKGDQPLYPSEVKKMSLSNKGRMRLVVADRRDRVVGLLNRDGHDWSFTRLAKEDWVQYQGKRGGKGIQNVRTGEILYGVFNPPEGRGDGQEDQPAQKSAQAPQEPQGGVSATEAAPQPAARQQPAGSEAAPQPAAEAPQAQEAPQQPGIENSTVQPDPNYPTDDQIFPKDFKFYKPDPQNDGDGDGVTDFSRVGVPQTRGKDKKIQLSAPPPPPIPSLPGLEPEERHHEQAFKKWYESDPDGVAKKYRELIETAKDAKGERLLNRNTFNTDDAKLLSPGYNPQGVDVSQKKSNRGIFNTAVHQTANAIAKRAFMQHMDEVVAKMPAGKRNILVTSGGCSSGKSYAIDHAPGAAEMADQAAAVWDAAGEQNGTENEWLMEVAKKHDCSITFAFCHNDPKYAWDGEKFGVIRRAEKKGRMVDARLYAESYGIGAKNFDAFSKKYSDKNSDGYYPKADFIFFDSSVPGKPKMVDSMPQASLDIDTEELYQYAMNALKEQEFDDHIEKGGIVNQRVWPKSGQKKQQKLFPPKQPQPPQQPATQPAAQQPATALSTRRMQMSEAKKEREARQEKTAFEKWKKFVRENILKNLAYNIPNSQKLDEKRFEAEQKIPPGF